MSDPGEGGASAESLPLTNENEIFNPAVKDINIVTKNLVTTDPRHARAPSTVSSGIAMQSDYSTGDRPDFTEDFPHGKSPHHARAPSTMSSGISMQSDHSTGGRPEFPEDFPHGESPHHARAPSTMSSGISMQSDHSTGGRPEFPEDFPHGESASSDEPGGVLCAVCPKRASKSCLTCMASYCETHVSMHYTAPDLQRHRLVEATGDLEQRLCPQHHRELEFYCRTDQTPVCVLCVAKQHGGHDIADQEQKPQMKECELTAQRNLPAPKPIQFISVKTYSVCLSWGAPDGLTEPHSFRVTWRSEADRGEDRGALTVPGLQVDIQDLTPGEKYTFTVATICDDGSQSACVSATVRTDIPAPECVNVSLKADQTSVSVSWSKPAGVDEVSYLLTLSSDGECLETITTEYLQCSFSGLDKGREYSINAVMVLKNGGQSKPIFKTITTELDL